MVCLERVVNLVKKLRIGLAVEEQVIHDELKDLFDSEKVEHKYEYLLGKGSRVDFFIPEEGLGLEVKKGKPNNRSLLKQVERYASFEEVKKILVVTERSVKLPSKVNGKECEVVTLHSLWF